MDLEKIIEDCLEWSNETFGSDKVSLRKMHHLKQEVDEVIDNLEFQEKSSPSDRVFLDVDLLVEFADCFILLGTAAKAKGFSLEEITQAMKAKLEINKQRDWGRPDENGVVNHIECKIGGQVCNSCQESNECGVGLFTCIESEGGRCEVQCPFCEKV